MLYPSTSTLAEVCEDRDGLDLGGIEVIPEDAPGPAGWAALDDLVGRDDEIYAEVVVGFGEVVLDDL